jgi:hypothetical protein
LFAEARRGVFRSAPHPFDLAAASVELSGLETFLGAHAEFNETTLTNGPMRGWARLACMTGALVGPRPIIGATYRFECVIQGVLRADLVVRRPDDSFVFVEFEGGGPTDLFTGAKQSRDWSRRIEHATSQVIDWDWALGDNKQTSVLQSGLGAKPDAVYFLIICGRDSGLKDASERERLVHRRESLQIKGRSLSILTWDQYAKELRAQITDRS